MKPEALKEFQRIRELRKGMKDGIDKWYYLGYTNGLLDDPREEPAGGALNNEYLEAYKMGTQDAIGDKETMGEDQPNTSSYTVPGQTPHHSRPGTRRKARAKFSFRRS